VVEIYFMSHREQTVRSESHAIVNKSFPGETSWPSGVP